jgi:PAS domain-containing protein
MQNKNGDALPEGENHFQKFIEHAPIAMAIINMNGVIELVNHKAVKIFGYTRDDVPTLDRWWAQAYPGVDYRKGLSNWMAQVQRAVADGSEMVGG